MTDSMGPKLRALLSTTEREGPGRGYPRHLREEAARYVLSRRAQGETFEQIARTLGVPGNTLLRWSRALVERSSAPDEAPFRRTSSPNPVVTAGRRCAPARYVAAFAAIS